MLVTVFSNGERCAFLRKWTQSVGKIQSPLGFPTALAFSSIKFMKENVTWELRGPVNLRYPRILGLSVSQSISTVKAAGLMLGKISALCQGTTALKLNLTYAQLPGNKGSSQKRCQK